MTAGLRVGFVGVGNMGWPMAGNIAAAGFETTVYDADPARAQRFEQEHAARAVDSLTVLGESADLVVTMLPTGREVREVTLGNGEDCLARGLADGAIIVDMSSSDPVGTRELGVSLRERNIELIDAPVSGLVTRAETGTLTIMIGADDEDALATATPVLEVLGERLIRIGQQGTGHAMKALNNFVGAAAFTATAEALIVGKRFGIDPSVMTQVLDVSTGRSFHSAMTFPEHVIPRRFASGFTLGLLAKDVGIAGALSSAVHAQTPLLELVTEMWDEARDSVGAQEDNSAVIRHWEDRNGVIID
ncbi:MAG: NAD(P)-dependent oxidoreductase [Gammaproteobacteria bacterium]|jgi:3-hydroxyisobutyrate dehydrogenase